MVTISPTSVIAIGGVHNARRSKNSYIYNSESNTWTQLRATLNLARAEHSCGLINRNSQSQEKSVIVAGSYGPEGFARTVEILDLDSMEWREGPDLPVEICCATMVEDPSGGVVLIGGRNKNQVFNTLYRLAHAGPDATWVEMPQKLKTARIRHVAFLVPDDITHCS